MPWHCMAMKVTYISFDPKQKDICHLTQVISQLSFMTRDTCWNDPYYMIEFHNISSISTVL